VSISSCLRTNFAATCRNRSIFQVFLVALGIHHSLACGYEPDCLESRSRIEWEDETFLGGSARTKIEALPTAGTTPIIWEMLTEGATFDLSGQETMLHWSFDLDPKRVYEIKSRPNPDNRNDNVKECYHRLEYQGTLAATSEDRVFDHESLPLIVSVYSPDLEFQEPNFAARDEEDNLPSLESLAGILSSALHVQAKKRELDWQGRLHTDGTYSFQINALAGNSGGGIVSTAMLRLACASDSKSGCLPLQ
jgi:hypothetical protein